MKLKVQVISVRVASKSKPAMLTPDSHHWPTVV